MDGADWPPTQFRLIYPKSVYWKQKDLLLYKQIANFATNIESFHNGKINLEQYTLPVQLIAFLLVTTKEDLKKQNVVEFGSGTGRISLPLLKFFSPQLFCIDIDYDVMYKLKTLLNLQNLNADLVVSAIEFFEINSQKTDYDTIIMNPPFGTKRPGIDLVFLNKALKLAQKVISIHKSNFQSRELISEISLAHYKSYEILATIEFSIPPTFAFHRKREHFVCVDIYRFQTL